MTLLGEDECKKTQRRNGWEPPLPDDGTTGPSPASAPRPKDVCRKCSGGMDGRPGADVLPANDDIVEAVTGRDSAVESKPSRASDLTHSFRVNA